MPLLPPGEYRKTRGIIRRGTRAAQPVATTVLEGTIYYVTDEGLVERSTGAAWQTYSGAVPAFTTGSVIFAGGAGQLAQDNANFFWDDTNNRLGLGLAAPTVCFDINVNAGGTVVTVGSRLANVTAATALATRQFSPLFALSGNAWDTDGGGSSVTNRIGLYARMLSGASTAAYLAIADQSDGAAAFVDNFYFGNAVAGATPDLRIRSGNIVFANVGRGIGFVTTPLTDAFNSNFAISGDVSAGLNRIVMRSVTGYLFVEGNNASAVAGVTPSMDFRNFDGSTAVPIVGIRHRATKGGGPSAGFGTRQQYQADSSTTTDQNQGALDVVWSDPTHASRSADVVFVLVNNAAAQAEKFRFKSNGEMLLTAAGIVTFSARSKVTSPADSQVLVTDNAGTAFDRMMFGGTAATFPALKRSSASLETKLADDSAYAQHAMLQLAIVDGVTAPAATVGLAKIYVDTADGDLKVIFGDGTVVNIVTD